MHDTAMAFGKAFFEAYAGNAKDQTIIDIGAQNVNGSLRSVAPPNNIYIGVDFVEGNGVDVVLTDPYILPFADNTADICVCSSCFEHAEFFWLLFTEILRILKPSGIFYLNVPSNGCFHRYPVDCWRFYPDSGIALQNWGRRNKYPVGLLESFTGMQADDGWNDFVAVFLKDESQISKHSNRMLDKLKNYTNGITYEKPDLSNFIDIPEDQLAHMKYKGIR